MGKKIDRFVLTLAAGSAFYFWFEHAFRNHVAAIVLALICCAVTVKTAKYIFALISRSSHLQKKQIRRHAGSIITHLACMPEEEAKNNLIKLIGKSYPGDYSVEIVQLYPSMTLPQEDVFRLWRNHLGEEKLVICATCRCDPACRMLASAMREPRIALVDAEHLAQLIAEHPEGMVAPGKRYERSKLRLMHILDLLINRKNAPRCMIFSTAMLLIYLMSANIWYLASAMLLLFIVLASFRRAPRPAKLF